jgi:hypothetical protein
MVGMSLKHQKICEKLEHPILKYVYHEKEALDDLILLRAHKMCSSTLIFLWINVWL